MFPLFLFRKALETRTWHSRDGIPAKVKILKAIVV